LYPIIRDGTRNVLQVIFFVTGFVLEVMLLFLCKCNQELAYFATWGLNILLFEESLFNSRQKRMLFLFSKASRQAMGPA